jgi:hypothetical protein
VQTRSAQDRDRKHGILVVTDGAIQDRDKLKTFLHNCRHNGHNACVVYLEPETHTDLSIQEFADVAKVYSVRVDNVRNAKPAKELMKKCAEYLLQGKEVSGE